MCARLYLRWHHSILIALVLAGTLLSSMHQSFLGGLYLITKGRLDPLWYTPYLTTMFYLSAIPAGLAVTIMAIYLCVRSLNVRVDMTILSDVSRVIAPLLAIYGVFRASRSDQPGCDAISVDVARGNRSVLA